MAKAEKPECNHTAIGVIVRDTAGRFALTAMGEFGDDFAPPAWHMDLSDLVVNGTEEVEAAVRNFGPQVVVRELGKLGIRSSTSGLHAVVTEHELNGSCKEQPKNNHHSWTVYEALGVTVEQDHDGARALTWRTQDELQQLAIDTQMDLATGMPPEGQQHLQLPWLQFLAVAGYIGR